MLESLKNCIFFYKKPDINFTGNKKDIYYLFIFFLIFSVLYSSFIIDPISSNFAIGPNSNEEAVKKIAGILIIIIGAPIIEEIIFRLPLSRNFQDIFFYLSAFLGLLIFRINFFPLAILLVIYGVFGSTFYEKYFKFLVWIIPIYFGLIHIINYEITLTNLFLAPLILMPQIVIGGVIGYVRLINGIIPAIIFHGLYNGFIILLWLYSG